ncbi:MAG TPA: AmmeMemoRadiSam system radical SAM enzyme [Firmicutes bacterium]|nr:AmmeMemoRadiSam system radical SAM enzyme [Bacillota bacterium]
MIEARFYERLDDAIRCLLCPRRCRIKPGAVGVCRTRKNVDGTLYAIGYGEYTSLALDPIEKKPLYHFFPGSMVLSVGTRGCNLLCRFCQNWEISQGDPPTRHIEPGTLVDMARRYAGSMGCIGIAYTYSEPLVWYEFVFDTARLARQAGMKNVVVTNGEINEEPLAELLPYIDAMNIDVKGFTDEFYQKTCGGELEPVLRTVERAHGKCHIELTNLIIPTLNDSTGEISNLVDWVASVGTEIPLHFSRYFPQYKLDIPPTPVSTLRRAREIARKKLKYVYIGNVPGGDGNDTYCYNCGQKVIERQGFEVVGYHIEDGKCDNCGVKIHLID